MAEEIEICCPNCKSVLTRDRDELYCQVCSKRFPIIEGIPSFIETNAFYEAKWTTPHRHMESLASKIAFFLSPSARFTSMAFSIYQEDKA